MKLTDIINEEKYTIIDPKGNPAGTGTKDQANQRQKKLGGSKKGYFVVPAKKALKARRTLEKYKFDFKNTKLQDLMSDLYFESVNEAKSYSNKFASWFTGTVLCNVKHPKYGNHKVTPDQIKYSSGDYKMKLFKNIEQAVKRGDITPAMIKQNESVNEANNDEKYVVIAFHEKGGGFVMTRPSSKKDAEDSARSITKSSDITQQKAVKVSDARKIKGLVGKQYLNEESVNEGASTEEKRIVMMAVKKIAKYRNVPLDYAVGDVMRAAQELERDIKKGKIK